MRQASSSVRIRKGTTEATDPVLQRMTDFEYTAAVHMLFEGYHADDLRCITAIHDWCDGRQRNPFNEIECGYHYARVMTSWAAVVALTGFELTDGRRGDVRDSPSVPPPLMRLYVSGNAPISGSTDDPSTPLSLPCQILLKYGLADSLSFLDGIRHRLFSKNRGP